MLLWGPGKGLERLSYDVPFLFQNRVPEELMMVYLDTMVKKRLQQPTDVPLNRRFYVQLLKRLTKEDAKLVFFDLLFDQESPEPGLDEAFAEAMQQNGRVTLVGECVNQVQGNVVFQTPIQPTPVLEKACAAIGIANVDEDKADFSVRRIYGGLENYPSASWAAAKVLKADVTREGSSRLEPRWLNYYCPPARLRAVALDQALAENGLASDYFRNKIVMIGVRTEAGITGAARDTFGNPYSRFDTGAFESSLSPGAAVHGLSLLNLLNKDWLKRLDYRVELLIVILWGVAVSLGLMRLAPWPATGVAALAAVIFATLSGALQLKQHFWFAWAIPVAAQTPVALVWSVGYRYLIESLRRQRLRQAFAVYASPYMADRIANSQFDLTPGGKEVEATILFTDLEGFTKMSESLEPAEVSKILIAYFNQTTGAILEQEGMVIKFIGDAVMAAWGAPLPEPQPAERAVLAALNIKKAGEKDIAGRRLRTRIGINSGKVLAGNLGSDVRFDYTLIGDTTNVAARLESLNKPLGTELLISDSTRALLSDRFQIRSLGQFVVSGRSKPVSVNEVIGFRASATEKLAWMETFVMALEAFKKGNAERATELFKEVLRLRGGADGPSAFYLRELQSLPNERSADGVIHMKEK